MFNSDAMFSSKRGFMITFFIQIIVMIIIMSLCCANFDGCAHISPSADEVIHGVDIQSHSHSMKRRRASTSLRMHIHHDISLTGLTSYYEQLMKSKILPQAVHYWEQTLQVQHSVANIKLHRRCLNGRMQYLRSEPGVPYCSQGCVDITTCGDISIPRAHLDRCYTCQGKSRCRKEGRPSRGVARTHFVLYVSAVHTTRCLRGHTIAYAAHCQLEKSIDRPVAGFLNICPQVINKATLREADLLFTIKHEVLHALGFTAGLYAFYRDALGRPYTPRNSVTNKPPYNATTQLYTWSDEVVRSVYRGAWRVAGGYTGHTVHVMVTPNVKREVRRHFNCSSLEGAEIENQESGGTALTHWEKRLFENEAMTGTYTQNPVISRITLALLHDTGWYIPRYENAQDLTWGRNLGCEFVKKSCLSWILDKQHRGESVHPYCTRPRDPSLHTECSIDRRAVTLCNLQLYPPSHIIPPLYRYFSTIEGSPRKEAIQFGGSVVLADYCPFIQEITWKNSDNSLRTSKCTDESNNADSELNYMLEEYGNRSMCLTHEAPFLLRHCQQSTHTKHWGAGCYRYACSPRGLVVIVAGVKHSCRSTGQRLHVSHKSSEWLHTGVIICPLCMSVCPASHCPRPRTTPSTPPPYSLHNTVPCSHAPILPAVQVLTLALIVVVSLVFTHSLHKRDVPA